MKNNLYLIVIISIFALLANANAAISPSLNTYLSTYVTSGVIANASFYNQSLNSNSYIIMQLTGRDRYVIIQQNSNSNYSLITNVTTIEGVLTPYLINKYYPSAATLQSLNTTMRQYMTYSAANLTSCIIETGLNSNTCTIANNCFSCQTVPVCKKVLNSVGGIVSPFGYGVVNFSINYNVLNQSYKNYFSLLSNINPVNAGTTIASLSTITSNISAVQSIMDTNPIFPPFSGENFNNCNSGQNPLQQPWYCVAVAYCFSIPFNTTALSSIQSTLSTLGTSLLSPTGTQMTSSNSSAIAQGYLNAYLAAKNTNAFDLSMAKYTPQYNAIVSNALSLLSKYNNATLNLSLQTLETQFKAINKLGINQTISTANTTLASLIGNTITVFKSANATYNQVYLTSQNNTGILLADELSYQVVPFKLASLLNQQQNINAKLTGRLTSNDVTATLPAIQTIKVESALFVAPFTIGYLIKQIDSSFINTMLSGGDSYAPNRIASAPFYAMVESLIIGILILLVIYLIIYFRLIKKGKFKNNKTLQRKWMIIFVVLFVIVLIYAYATYAYAQNANNNFLPFNYFLNSVKANQNIYIALNGSAATNFSIGQCVTKIESYLTKAGKSTQLIDLKNYSCVSGNNISTLGLDCYVNILSSDKPVIFISQSQQNQILYKGLYGTVLYASGDVATGSSCTLSTLFSNT